MTRFFVLFPIVLAIFPVSAAAQQTLGGATASVALSMSLKFANRQPDVDFEVVQPNGDHSTATAKAPYNGERAGTAVYPSDFTNAGMHSGTYKWTARAAGKIIGSGSFRYVPSKGGLQVFTPF